MIKKKNLSEYLRGNINYFYKLLNKEYNRYNSWEYCYLFFQKYKHEANRNQMTEDDLELAALNLSFYLASWGMYRGSSFLLQYDYKIFKSLIKNLFQSNELNKIFWDINIDTLDIDAYIEGLSIANKIITGCLEKYSFKEEKNIDNNFNLGKITSTLITKILMGIYGCVPAYDRFFCDGLNELKNKYNYQNQLSQNYSKSGISKLLKFVKAANKKGLWLLDNKKYKLHNNNQIDYPIMKLVDMCFWQIGYNNSFKGIEIKNNEVVLHRNMKDRNTKIIKINEIKNFSSQEKDNLLTNIRGKKIIYSDKESVDIIVNYDDLIDFINNKKCKLFCNDFKNDIELID